MLYSIVLEILNDAVTDWKEDDTHHLQVFFPAEAEFKIKELLA